MFGDTAGAPRLAFASRDPAAGAVAPVAFRWAPDGRALFVKAFDPAGQATLWSVPAAGGTPRLLVRFDDPLRPARRPEFATDGRRFFFTFAQSESDVWVVDVK